MNEDKPKFTPGPWKVSFPKKDDEWMTRIAVIAKNAERYSALGPICLVGKRRGIVSEANTFLIAAAPEMYALLELLAKRYKPDSATRQRIDALLAKARGNKA